MSTITYLFESDNINPVTIEAELGVARGMVKKVVFLDGGAVEVEIDDSIDTPQNKQKIKDILVRNGKIKGKKK